MDDIDSLLAEADALCSTGADEPVAAHAPARAGPVETAARAAQPACGAALPMPDFGGDARSDLMQPIDLLRDVGLHVKIELGRCQMLVEDVLRLAEGSIVELNKLAGDPVDIYANERLVARGEVLVLNDHFCVRVNEIVSDETQALPASDPRVSS
jgi:flagellar motor switch protein FliN/FliY